MTAFAPTANGWIAALPDGSIHRYPGDTIVGKAAHVTALAVRGDLVVAGDQDGMLTLLGAITGTIAVRTGPVTAIAIAPDGRVAVASPDATRVLDLSP